MLTEKQIRFCNEYVMGKDASNSYSIAFNKANSSSTRAAASRLLKSKEIQSFISDLQENNKKIVDLANNKAAEIVVEGSIADAAERMTLLTKIMRGELKVKSDKFFFDSKNSEVVAQPVDEIPDHGAIIKAITELNKMDGSYAPTKSEVKEIKEQPLFPDSSNKLT